MISEKELNDLCAQKQQPINLRENGYNYSIYTLYVSWGLWSSMEPNRMLQILTRMEESNYKLKDSCLDRIKLIKEELKAKINAKRNHSNSTSDQPGSRRDTEFPQGRV